MNTKPAFILATTRAMVEFRPQGAEVLVITKRPRGGIEQRPLTLAHARAMWRGLVKAGYRRW